jgi:hypothetical protein
MLRQIDTGFLASGANLTLGIAGYVPLRSLRHARNDTRKSLSLRGAERRSHLAMMDALSVSSVSL